MQNLLQNLPARVQVSIILANLMLLLGTQPCERTLCLPGFAAKCDALRGGLPLKDARTRSCFSISSKGFQSYKSFSLENCWLVLQICLYTSLNFGYFSPPNGILKVKMQLPHQEKFSSRKSRNFQSRIDFNKVPRSPINSPFYFFLCSHQFWATNCIECPLKRINTAIP